jgi:hypothetical protein
MSLEFRKRETYLALIKNSVGSSMFQDLYFLNNNEEPFEGIEPGELVNIAKNGELSCPYFVSSVLHLLGGVIDAPHATIEGTVKAMQARGWQKLRLTDDLRPGDVVVWEKNPAGDSAHYSEGHGHIGFILDRDTAVSTSARKKAVIAHDPYFKNMGEDIKERQIVEIYAHPELTDHPELQKR